MRDPIILGWVCLIFVGMAYGGVSHQCPLDIDRWYRIEEDWSVHAPDKFQHAFFSYVGQRLGGEWIGEVPTFICISFGGVFKEFLLDDEGFSVRDIGANCGGCVGGVLDSDGSRVALLPTWEEGSVGFVVMYRFR